MENVVQNVRYVLRPLIIVKFVLFLQIDPKPLPNVYVNLVSMIVKEASLNAYLVLIIAKLALMKTNVRLVMSKKIEYLIHFQELVIARMDIEKTIKGNANLAILIKINVSSLVLKIL